MYTIYTIQSIQLKITITKLYWQTADLIGHIQTMCTLNYSSLNVDAHEFTVYLK